MKVLVTGGAGYIGSHFVRILVNNNIECIVLDNLSRGHKESVPQSVKLEVADLLNFEELKSVIKNNSIDAIVHFAAFAYVGESVENPSLYYQNNVIGSYNLIKAAVETNVKKFVFSSTCSLYGNPEKVPISEEQKTNPINPYAQTKLIIENMLRDFEAAYGIKSVCLRYFNAAGASFDGEIGESHNPEPHLIPIVINTGLGLREKVFVYGDDYETPDGTCIRDYIHVDDLGDAHLRSLNYLNDNSESQIINLGTGEGNSVKSIIETTEKITKNKITSEIVGRRAGDPAILIADNQKANMILGWKPKYNLDDIILTAYNWHKNKRF
ncbi:MAG: UDP-glucose 4-epimerase GalE [Ignavibacteriae bacterium]|nr:UDP-glucose 4-epimerase GalE [Ignavibacteriota bacterium]MCB9210542.1 UDP-glucose 4-epimerase GalE [Ignavibacteriales bacterium]MCB9257748.1 UDP-glucose 4-epimerase GalE [Ignavibacteriales bacterium]